MRFGSDGVRADMSADGMRRATLELEEKRFPLSLRLAKLANCANVLQNLNFANFWRARSRLYQNEILQENMRLTTFFKFYKMCTLLHNCDKRIFRAVAYQEPDRSNIRRDESTSDENIFSRKVRRTAAWIESEAAPRENPTN